MRPKHPHGSNGHGIDPALLVSLAFFAGGYAPGATTVVLVTAPLVLLVLVSRATSPALAMSMLALAAGAFRAQTARSEYDAAYRAARAEFMQPRRCAGNGLVRSSPAVHDGKASYLLDFDELDCEGRIVRGPLRVRLHSDAVDVRRGDTRAVIADLAPVRLFRNFGVGDPSWHAARHGAVLSGTALADDGEAHGSGLGAWIDRARAHSRERIDATFAASVAPMARALVLGENDLAPEDDAAFKRSGLAHILAVSGTHLVFAVLLLVKALRGLLVRIETLAARFAPARIASGIGAALALVYADFAGGSGSAWRAAFMLSAALFVQALGRRPTLARSIAASLLSGALVDPLAAYDISFLLSLAATSGLCLIARPLATVAEAIGFRPLRYLLLSLLATLGATIPCAPLIALLTPHQTLAGLFANVVAGPLGEIVALPLCLLHSLLAPLPSVEAGAAIVGSGALRVVRAIALASAEAEALAWSVPPPSPWQLGILAVAGAFLFARTADAGKLASFAVRVVLVGAAALALWLVEAALRRVGTPSGELVVTMLDVGQGDALLIDLPDGKLMLIDGGGFVGSPVDPGRAVILPALRARRRDRIDIMVLSHPHPDHFTGLLSVAEHVAVTEFWDTGQGEAAGAGPVYRELLDVLRARGTRILRPAELCGAPRRFGAAEVHALAPCPDFSLERSANDNSFVLRAEYGERSVLLVGDAEAREEAELVDKFGSKLHADLLKAGHHGSRTSSTSAFLRAVTPHHAFISSGVRNRFGHPHGEALARLAAAEALVLRTDDQGALEWATDGRAANLRTFRNRPRQARDAESPRAHAGH